MQFFIYNKLKEGPHYILSQCHMPVLFGLSAKIHGHPNIIPLPLVKGEGTGIRSLNLIIEHDMSIY